jgi:uncharacterized protein
MSTRRFLSENEQRAVDTFVHRLESAYGSRVRSVILFGSKARGDFGPDSDIDVLVSLADDDPELRWQVQLLAARISLDHDLLLSVRAVSRSQWNKLASLRTPLYRAVTTEGIALTPSPA